MKIDENGVLYKIELNDIVDGTLIIPEGVKKIDCKLADMYYYVEGEAKSRSMSEKIKNIQLPNSLIEIGKGCFQALSNVEKIILPDSVTKIGANAFYKCSAKQIRLSRRLEEIGNDVFISCDLDFLIIPDSVKEINYNAFSTGDPWNDKTRIKYLRFPQKMENLYMLRFKKMLWNGDTAILPQEVENLSLAYGELHGVERLYDVNIVMPNKFKFDERNVQFNIGEITERAKLYTFRNSEGLKQFQDNINTTYKTKENIKKYKLKNDNEPIGRRKIGMNDTGINKLQSSRLKIEGTDVIGEFAFSECQNLEEVIIGEGVKSIERGAFAQCPNLKRIVLPKSLENIGSRAFWGCESLEQIEIISDLERIGDNAFLDCKSLRAVDSLGKIKKIEKGAFRGCEQLMCFNSQYGSETIEEKAFEDCSKLLLAPLKNGVKYIGDGAFKNCNSLISINFPEGVEQIGDNAFENCCSIPLSLELPIEPKDESKITKMEIPNKIIVTIPSSAQHIGKYAFSGCKNIAYVHMMDGCKVKEIEEGTFLGCDKMETFDISSDVQIIGEKAFKDCKSLMTINCLKEVGLPEKMEKIESKAFENCESLGLFLTNGKVKKEADSFNGANKIHEADIKDLNPNVEIVENQLFDVIEAPKKKKTISLQMIKEAINKVKNKGKTH